jgi:hypothetical protein
MNESIGTACAVNEVEEEEDKFQTPGLSSSPDDVALDINALNEGRVDELLETILALVQAVSYIKLIFCLRIELGLTYFVIFQLTACIRGEQN